MGFEGLAVVGLNEFEFGGVEAPSVQDRTIANTISS